MVEHQSGSVRLFRIAGIDVCVHWSWLIVAYFEISTCSNKYPSLVWNVAEYLLLFGIVLFHEFGHAAACRQVGGVANRIMLWPLGGVAFVNPPPRPGALLWSIAAGPLVNVALVPLTVGLYLLGGLAGWKQTVPEVDHFLLSAMFMNGILLIFNLLPIYPLDGGQILQALLWFVIGRARSLLVVSVIGLAAGIGFIAASLWARDWWFAVLALFIAIRSAAGFQQARTLARLAKAPRYAELACPSCGMAPLVGAYWVCNHCQTPFDTFKHWAVCPTCGAQFPETACPNCQRRHPISAWVPAILPAETASVDTEPEEG